MTGTRRTRALWLCVLACAVVPRLFLALYNEQANDPHDEVIRLILENGRAPLVDDCWACYQPKLFHHTVAAASRILEISDPLALIELAQLINFAAALGTLGVLWLIAQRLGGREDLRLLAFAVVSINPRFNAVTAQATNDSFALLFGTVTVYGFWQAWQGGRTVHMALAIAGVIVMSLSKTQGTVFFAMLVVLLAVKCAFSAAPMRRRVGGSLVVLVVAYAAIVPFVGPYYDHYQQKGDAFAANWERMPAPHWIEQTLYRRPGVRSVVDGYLTFRLIDMLRKPWIEHGWCRGGARRRYAHELAPTGIIDRFQPISRDPQEYDPRCSAHRTSVWSQLYGRAQSLRFANNPSTWRIKGGGQVQLGRALLLVGLLPLSLLLLGVVAEARDLFRGVLRRGPRWLAESDRWILLAIFGGAIVVVAYLPYLMRDFSSIKPIYAFPALGCVLALYLRGLSAVTSRCAGRGTLRALNAAHVLLIALYLVDMGWLVVDLR